MTCLSSQSRLRPPRRFRPREINRILPEEII
jgi:hypothetical protein